MSSPLDAPEEDDEQDPELPVPDTLTPELFHEWRSPRFGSSNPERLNNPLWEWLVRSRWSAYRINDHFQAPSACSVGPGWCFSRFGQSTTPLPDGRLVMIAGEHEDHYDPDFFIYNDVVVRRPDGALDIFGYPPEVFPPTDFHSATLAGELIILIGSLGYQHQRRPGTTPVAILDLGSFAIRQVETCATPPGWLHGHTATLSEDGASILIRGGKIERDDEERTHVENIDEWRLHLDGWRWERLTDRQWQRWKLRRSDRKAIHLYEIDQVLSYRNPGWNDEFEKRLREVTQKCGKAPDLDVASRLYRPDCEHESLPEVEGELWVTRIRVQGVIVRYVEDMYSLQMTIEGALPQPIITALRDDLLARMEILENAPCEWRQL